MHCSRRVAQAAAAPRCRLRDAAIRLKRNAARAPRRWKEVRHDTTVTWLAYWKDPIDMRGYKYVFLGANSTFKTESDLAKYEKARLLKDHIERIRADYTKLWSNADVQQRQMSTALYFIDVLALRAGHEKDEDEAETVGCCTLKARGRLDSSRYVVACARESRRWQGFAVLTAQRPLRNCTCGLRDSAQSPADTPGSTVHQAIECALMPIRAPMLNSLRM